MQGSENFKEFLCFQSSSLLNYLKSLLKSKTKSYLTCIRILSQNNFNIWILEFNYKIYSCKILL